MNRSTETIARETIAGLVAQVVDLTAPENDGNPLPWGVAEDKMLEMVKIVQTVQAAIMARSLKVTA